MMRGLYVHLPFCVRKCDYCDFVITTKRSTKFRERFFRALGREIERAVKAYGRMSFDTVYFGGGTPSDLSPGEMTWLVETLQKSFRIAEGCEFTCEVNPGEVDYARLESYRKAGVNRISLGAQAFQDRLLKSLGRIHQAQAIFETVRELHALGFTHLSFDLMLRLPGQTLRDLEDSLQQAVSLGAAHVSLYDLDLHPRTLFGLRWRRGDLELPTEEEHARLFESAVRFLTRQGFRHYELTNFAKPGFESRHNLIYWRNQEYLGLGPGAFSCLGGVRSQFASSVNRYLEKTEAGETQPEESEVLSPEKKELETLLTGLRLDEGVDFASLPRLGKELSSKIRLPLEKGLLVCHNNRLRVTAAGRYVFETLLLEIYPGG